jgi:hypothetical protein
MVLMGLLLPVVFGPGKLSGMTRDFFGRFVSKAPRYEDEFEAGPGDPGELSFEATISGRFDIENHNSDPHEVLGELLVQPG